MIKTKVFPAYLPQYHETEINNAFWGKGYTDWVGVRNARPQFQNHVQPKIPLNQYYYDLSNIEAIKWQAAIAHKYGIAGFNIYHYWFKNGQQALEKPAELLLENPDVDIEYFFSWDNCSWVRSWSGVPGNEWAPSIDGQNKNGNGSLLERDYGDESDWSRHFDYLLKFFKDTRYLKINDKPVFMFMTNIEKEKLRLMGDLWNKKAKENGFKGMYLVSRVDEFRNQRVFNKQFIYQPPASTWGKRAAIEGRLLKYFHLKISQSGPVKYLYDYDEVWNNILKNSKKLIRKQIIVGGLVSFDDTPRRGSNARVINGATPQKFGNYFRKLYKMCCESNQPIVLLTAWNEWGEGAYLEPDEENGYAYLEALKRAIDSVDSEKD